MSQEQLKAWQLKPNERLQINSMTLSMVLEGKTYTFTASNGIKRTYGRTNNYLYYVVSEYGYSDILRQEGMGYEEFEANSSLYCQMILDFQNIVSPDTENTHVYNLITK